jgi:pimeloyl-ACP methyl ester carboxylesterase
MDNCGNDSCEILPHPKCVISGKHVLDYARTNLKGAQTIELHDVAHYPQIEAPDLVSQAILKAI